MGLSKTALLLCVLESFSVFAGDYETVVDDSVVGYWRFDNVQNYAEDSSSSQSDITGWSNGAAGKADAGRGGGYLNLPKSGSNYGDSAGTDPAK